MKINNRLILLISVFILLTFDIVQTVFATPDAPRVVINHTTRECDPLVYWRDECGEVTLPSGWEYHTESACPAEYTVTELQQLEWKKYQNDFCCQNYGGTNCPGENPASLSPSPLLTLVIETAAPAATPEPAGPSPRSVILPVAGGLSLLAGLGLGIYSLLGRKKAS
jgi:hypothetical protein